MTATVISSACAMFAGIFATVAVLLKDRRSAEHLMIDQLQEELAVFRQQTEQRLATLEDENRGYRAFIGVQRDHMAAHHVPLPPWPDGLPR